MATLALKNPAAHLLFQSGRIEVVLGPPGSGKSKLLRLLAGLESEALARVYAAGVEVTALDPAHRRIRYVAPAGVAYPGLSVLDNLLLGLDSRAVEGRAREAAARFGLTDLLGARADVADADVRQRMALAKAAASGASAVLLDQPFAAFDSLRQAWVRRAVQAAFVGRDRIVVVATNCPREAACLGGGLHVVSAGSVLQRGTLRGVMAAPANELVATLVFSPPLSIWPVMLVTDATLGRVVQLSDRLVVPAPAAWQELVPGPYRLGIPAHRVHPERRHAADIELRGEVVRVEAIAGQLAVTARVDGRELAFVGAARPDPRQPLALFTSLPDLLVFSPQGRTVRLAREEAIPHGAH